MVSRCNLSRRSNCAFAASHNNSGETHRNCTLLLGGEWTCTVADFTGTMRGSMTGPDGKLVAPTNKKFHTEFCTVAHWKNGEVVEEKLFYDLVGLLKQSGVM
jgi:ketosteroid isomerase-like protein